jgi:type IV secretory pathway VirB6-like protein
LLLRTLKNSGLIVGCVLLLIGLVTVVAPEPAYAYNFNSYGPAINAAGDVCPQGVPGSGGNRGLTRRIVPCVKETLVSAVNNFLIPFSQALYSTIAAACTLAIAIGGIWVASGRINAALRDMTVLFIKIFFVAVMTWNFGGLFGVFLDVMEDLLAMAGSGAIHMSSLANHPACPSLTSGAPASLLVWERVDCSIEVLVGGVFSYFTLSMGIAGFLMSALLSSTSGVFVALLGFYIVVQFLYAVAKAVYTFLSAYMAFTIMVLVSPLFIPCILFRVSKPFFDKWLRLTLSFILQPMIVFAYLSMLVVAFDFTVFKGPFSVYRVIAGDAVDNDDFQLGAYLLQVPAYAKDGIGGKAIGINPRKILKELPPEIPQDTGTIGIIAGMPVNTAVDDWTKHIYSFLGLGDNDTSLRFIKVDWPTTAVNWPVLAAAQGNSGGGDEMLPNFFRQLFASLFMAAIVAYIFLSMLDALPYLSAGLAGVPAGMPTLGHGNIAPPGSNLMETFKAKMDGWVKGGGVKMQ